MDTHVRESFELNLCRTLYFQWDDYRDVDLHNKVREVLVAVSGLRSIKNAWKIKPQEKPEGNFIRPLNCFNNSLNPVQIDYGKQIKIQNIVKQNKEQ